MKFKCIAFTLVMILIFSMAGCTSKSLPRGHAEWIDLADGATFHDCEFEYVNEHTVKIITDDGRVLYVPINNIDRIYVE